MQPSNGAQKRVQLCDENVRSRIVHLIVYFIGFWGAFGGSTRSLRFKMTAVLGRLMVLCRDMELTVLNQLMDHDTGDVGKLLWLTGPIIIPKTNQFSEVTVANYTDTFFRYRFRMSRSTVEILTRMIGACPEIKTEPDSADGHPPIPMEKQTLILLWYFGNIEPYTSIGKRFGVAPSEHLTL